MNAAEHLAEAERLTEAARADFRNAEGFAAQRVAEARAHVALAAANVHVLSAIACLLGGVDDVYIDVADAGGDGS